MQRADSLAEKNKHKTPTSTLKEPLRGLSADLFYVLDLVRNPGSEWAYMDDYLTQNVFMPMDDAIQDHLDRDARDRLSGTIKQRKGGIHKKQLPFVQATYRDIQNFSDSFKRDLNTEVLPAILQLEVGKVRKEIEQRTVVLHWSAEQLEEEKEMWWKNDKNLTYTHLYDLHTLAWNLLHECEAKEHVLKVLNPRMQVEKDLVEYYGNFVLPMSQTHYEFSFDRYVAPPSQYKRYANELIAKHNNVLRPLLQSWELKYDRPFLVDGKKYLETMDVDFWRPVDIANRRRKKSNSQSRFSLGKDGAPKRSRVGPDSKADSDEEEPVNPYSKHSRSASADFSRGRLLHDPDVLNPLSTSGASIRASSKVPALLLSRPISHQRPPRQFAKELDPSNRYKSKRVELLDFPEDEESAANGGKVHVTVVTRIRPMLPFETAKGDDEIVRPAANSRVELRKPRKPPAVYPVDLIAPTRVDQTEFYELCDVQRLLDRSLRGAYVTVFAYGQTGSGKTHTINGPEEVIGLHERVRIDDRDGKLAACVKECLGRVLAAQLTEQGIMPRCARYVFDRIVEEEENDPNVEYEMRCSYVQIHEENILDLLDNNAVPLDVKMNTGERKGFHVPGLTEVVAKTADDVMGIFVKGSSNRKTCSHLLNAESSRSHAMFSMIIDKRVWVSEENTLLIRRGKITLVDLAGSENLKQTHTKAKNLREMSTSNQSLLSLSQVFTALAKERFDNTSAAFRSSKLTMLLMESLTNFNSTTMVACVSPASSNSVETNNVLTFAKNAASISRRSSSSTANTDHHQQQHTPTRVQTHAKKNTQVEREKVSFSNSNSNVSRRPSLPSSPRNAAPPRKNSSTVTPATNTVKPATHKVTQVKPAANNVTQAKPAANNATQVKLSNNGQPKAGGVAQKELDEWRARCDLLARRCEDLLKENEALKGKQGELTSENDGLRTEKDLLMDENKKLRDALRRLL